MTSLSLRGLVENPYELEARPTRGTGRKPHPLGAGIARRTTWLSHPYGPLLLPMSGSAVDHLLQARQECLPRDLEEFAESAWAGLIAEPVMAIPLAQTLGTPEESTRRSFGLVTVFKRPDENLTRSGLMHPRIAATSRLTLELAEETGFIEAAALRSDWHTSSPALLADLALFSAQALPGLVPARPVRRITVLIHPDLSVRLTDDDRSRLAGLAALLESDVDLVDRSRMDKFSVMRRIAGAGGGALVAVGPMDSTTRGMQDAYLAVDPDRLLRHVSGEGPRDLFEAILEQVMEVSGVSGSLLPIVPADKTRKSREGRPPIPIANPVECLHHGNRFYLKDGETELWWTRDNDRHAGSIFKTYQEHDGMLEHEADRDAAGTTIDKHKGPNGMQIPRSQLHGCPKAPQKHLQ